MLPNPYNFSGEVINPGLSRDRLNKPAFSFILPFRSQFARGSWLGNGAEAQGRSPKHSRQNWE